MMTTTAFLRPRTIRSFHLISHRSNSREFSQSISTIHPNSHLLRPNSIESVRPQWGLEPLRLRHFSTISSKHLSKGKTIVPDDFGAPNGTTISNIDTIADEIDQALGVSKPPDVEVILTDHMAYVANPLSRFLHLAFLRFGHIAIRYTTSDGVQHVMNILGDFSKPNSQMINFQKPEDYWYGTKGFETFSQQGGVYNRPFVGVRIENVTSGATDAMHKYYQALDAASKIGRVNASVSNTSCTEKVPTTRSTKKERKSHELPGDGRMGEDINDTLNKGAVRFHLVDINLSKLAREVPEPLDRILLRISDFFREADEARKTSTERLLRQANVKETAQEVERSVHDVRDTLYNAGNCAQWTSEGLDFVGLIRRARLFPKAILIELLESEVLYHNRPQNVNVVYYSEVKHAVKADPNFQYILPTYVHPLKPGRNIFYDDMRIFASAIVTVPEGTTRAIVEAVPKPPRKPEPFLRYISFGCIYGPAAILVGLVDQIGPIGPTVAAVWLFLNWWLH